MRFLWLLTACFLALLPSLHATTVQLERETCPACGHDFVGSAFGSWFQFGEVRRDLSNSLYAASLRLETCPYCLFSALDGDFEKLPKARRAAIRAELAKLPAGVRPFPEEALKAVKNDPGVARTAMQLRLAQLCARDPDDGVAQATRALAAYYRRGDTPGLRDEGRTLFIQTATRVFAQDGAPGPHLTLFYLLGEFQRQSGATRDAAETFDRVQKLDQRPADESMAKWAGEQRKLALAGNTRAVGKEAEPEVDERTEELKKKLPTFLAALNKGRPSREWTLPPGERVTAQYRLSDTYGAARTLAEAGHVPAAQYLVAVLAQASTGELEDWMVEQGIAALAQHPESAREAVVNAKFRVKAFGEAARYAVTGGEIPAFATAFLAEKGKWSASVGAVVRAATERRDARLKDAVIQRSGGKRVFDFNWAAQSYLRAMAGAEDLPALEKLAERTSLQTQAEGWDPGWSERRDFEGTMLEIRLRLAARKLANRPQAGGEE
jgi:hypothetical protein